jgi:hypothetical protein
VPVVLKGFDRAMLTYLLDNTGDQLSNALHNKIRANTVKGEEAEMTGKQALNMAVLSFGKSLDNINLESYQALSSFTVPENADPATWENAFADYDLRICMASDGRVGDEEHSASILLATLVKHLNRSPHNALSGLKVKLEDLQSVKTKQQELSWYKDQVTKWSRRVTEESNNEAGEMRASIQQNFAQIAINEAPKNVQESFTKNVDNKWAFKSELTNAQMKRTYDVLSRRTPTPAGLAMSAACYEPVEANPAVKDAPAAAPFPDEASEVRGAIASIQDSFAQQAKAAAAHMSQQTANMNNTIRQTLSNFQHANVNPNQAQGQPPRQAPVAPAMKAPPQQPPQQQNYQAQAAYHQPQQGYGAQWSQQGAQWPQQGVQWPQQDAYWPLQLQQRQQHQVQHQTVYTPGRFEGVPGLDYDPALRMGLIMLQVGEESRTVDELDQEIQEKCWAFTLNSNGCTDTEGKAYEDCGRSAGDCFRSHDQPEEVGDIALKRMAKLRDAQLERQKKGKNRKANKAKGDNKGKGGAKGGAKGGGRGQEQGGWGQQPQARGYCSYCKAQGHRNQDCTLGGADIDWQAEAREARDKLLQANVTAIANAAAQSAIQDHMANIR